MEQAGTPGTGSQGAVDPRPTTGAQPVLETTDARLARLERRVSVLTLALGAAVILALAAGIVGVVLALGAKNDSATKDEVTALKDQLQSVQQDTAKAAQQDLASISDRLDAIEGRVNTIAADQRTTKSEVSVLQDDIDELRSQIADLQSAGGGQSDTK